MSTHMRENHPSGHFLSMEHTTDIEIRRALHKKVLMSQHKCSSTIVIDELGLAHGKNRIDIAVLNGCLHGYEIKSSKDNLLRLPDQLVEYRRSLQKLTLVVAPNHVDEIVSIAPEWSGIVLADKGGRGAIAFSTVRRSQRNPEVEAVALAHLLWKKEAINFLEELGVEKKLMKGTRLKLYENICSRASINELIDWIKTQFMERESWRADLLPSQYGESRLLAST